jgi:predicted membrane channel-forming protein YqfA (hemolysin III family)
LILGVWHFGVATRAIFVLRETDPLSAVIVLLAGPLSTLPATLLAIFSRRLGAAWLIAGGVISFVALMVYGVMQAETVAGMAEMGLTHLVTTAGPMILLGLGVLWLDRYLARTT